MSRLYTRPLRWLRVLNPWITRNMGKAVRYAHRRVDRASLVRQCFTPRYNAKTRGLLLLTTILAESFDDYSTPIEPSEPENITTIRKVEDLEEMLLDAGERLVVIFCMVRWCPFCKYITPTVEEIAAKRPKDLVILKLDMDDEETESSRIMARYKAYFVHQGNFAVGLPTFVFIKDREKLEHFSGADVGKLKVAVNRYI